MSSRFASALLPAASLAARGLGDLAEEIGGAPLQNHHHLACARAIRRADRCGIGRSCPADRLQIHIDDEGIQSDAAAWPTDAEWIPNGARCIHSARSWNAGQGTPTCWVASWLTVCGFINGGLLIDEYKQ